MLSITYINDKAGNEAQRKWLSFELLNHKVVHSGYNKAQYLVYLFGQGLNSVEHYRGWTVVFSIPDHPQNNNTKVTLLIEANDYY